MDLTLTDVTRELGESLTYFVFTPYQLPDCLIRWGECRSYNFGNTWYEEIGGCPWFHHWYPYDLFKKILRENNEEHFEDVFWDHMIHDESLERLFFDHRNPY